MALIELIGNLLRGQISEKIADRNVQDGLRGRVPYAGFGQRFGAFLIDSLILSVVIVPMQILMGNAGTFFAGIIIVFYNSIMESMQDQATIGKKILGLQVTDLDEKPIPLGKAFARNFVKMISLAMCGIGCLFSLFTEKRQSLHDILAGCLVVKADSSPPPVQRTAARPVRPAQPAAKPTGTPPKAPPNPRT